MIYKKPISKWKQWIWFRKINNKFNFYFLIKVDEKYIGLINGKDIDLNLKSSEGGIFIWEKKYWNTHIPVAASIIMNDFNFFLAEFEVNYAKVLKENKTALDYNLCQGYKILEERNDGVLILKLTKEDYKSKIIKFRKTISKLTNDTEPLSYKNISLKDTSQSEMRKLYTGLPKHLQELVNKVKEREA